MSSDYLRSQASKAVCEHGLKCMKEGCRPWNAVALLLLSIADELDKDFAREIGEPARVPLTTYKAAMSVAGNVDDR